MSSGDHCDPTELNEHVALLVTHYGLSPDAGAALASFAAMVLDADEDALADRPASTSLVVNRLSASAAAVELEKVRSARRIVDIGSGLGFPALVLAAMLPRARFTLVEKKAERCDFLLRAISTMGLQHVEVVNKQARGLQEGAAGMDLFTARSVARPSTLVRFAAPLLAVGGTAVIWGNVKRDPAKEAAAERAAEAVGLRAVGIHQARPVGAGRRYLYVYEKTVEAPLAPVAKPKTPHSSIARRERKRARARTVADAHLKAVERLERVSGRVRQLEAAMGSKIETDRRSADLERARALARKVERRVEILARRRARAERKLKEE